MKTRVVERRTSTRHPVGGTLRLTRWGGTHRQTDVVAHLRDVSSSGVCAEFCTRTPPGIHEEFHFTGGLELARKAQVVWCNGPIGGFYRVGMNVYRAM